MRLAHERHTVVESLKDRRVLAFGLLYFTMVVNVYGLSFWVGEIVDKVGGLSDVGKGFVTAIPYTVAIVGLVAISRYSDRTGARKPVAAVSMLVAAAAFALSTVVSPVAAIACLAVGLFFLLGAHPVFWAMPAAFLSGAAAAAGIALINSIGNLGGFVGPYLVGLMKDATGSTDGGLIALSLHPRGRLVPGHARRARPRDRDRAERAHRPLRARAGPGRGGRAGAVSEIGVIADDLTGALGSAARLRRGGLEPVVVWRPEDLPDAFNPRAVVVDMRTRDSPAGPRATAREWAQRLRERGCARYEQRIDSTLRGEPAEELAGLLEGADLQDALVVAVPAWPDAGRVCVGGRQRARGTGREVEVAPALFGGAPAEVVRPEALAERVRAGATRRFVVDGESDEDLRAAAHAVDGLREAVVTASPGGWLQYHPIAARAGAEFVLVVLSSNTELNHRQLAALWAARDVVGVAALPAARAGVGPACRRRGTGARC